MTLLSVLTQFSAATSVNSLHTIAAPNTVLLSSLVVAYRAVYLSWCVFIVPLYCYVTHQGLRETALCSKRKNYNEKRLGRWWCRW